MIGRVIVAILVGLYEPIEKLLAAGSSAEQITAALQLTLDVAFRVSGERIAARAEAQGVTLTQREILAIWCDDLAASLRASRLEEHAAALDTIAASIRGAGHFGHAG